MTPKERKDLIFKKSRPLARKLAIMEGDNFSKDAGILWAAYKAGSFTIEPGLTQEQFMEIIDTTFKTFQNVWIIDDDTSAYSSGRGPIGIVAANAIGLIVEPKFTFFKWATCRNILKATVAFLTMLKGSLETGIILIRSDDTTRGVTDHMKKYNLLYFIGKSGEREYLYSGRGRGSTA